MAVSFRPPVLFRNGGSNGISPEEQTDKPLSAEPVDFCGRLHQQGQKAFGRLIYIWTGIEVFPARISAFGVNRWATMQVERGHIRQLK